MKFANAARRFDQTVFADAYNSATTFLGQIKPFDDVLRDALPARRRLLETAPDVAIPLRRVITQDRTNWIVGEVHEDYFRGTVLRRKYVLHPATESTALKTFSEVLSGAAGYQVYASREFMKVVREPTESSLELGLYDIYLPRDDMPTADQKMIYLDGRWHLVRVPYPSAGGFSAALCDELLDPVINTASWTHGTYDRATDTRSTVTVSVQALLLRWQSYFSLPVASAPKYERGDDMVVINKPDATPAAGQQLAIAGITYNVLSVMDETTHWSCHVRRT